jgi:hypothetical protein
LILDLVFLFAVAADSLPSDEDEMKSYISEFLLMSPNGQNYIKDIKFSSFPFGDYNITVIVYRYSKSLTCMCSRYECIDV